MAKRLSLLKPRLDFKHNFAEDSIILQQSLRLARLMQGQPRADDRLDATRECLLHESFIILMWAHGAADERDMPREKLRHIQVKSIAAGAADNQDAPADATSAHALP